MAYVNSPMSYKDIVYANAATAKLVDDIVTNKLPFPAHGKNGLLIYGPNGTGKSTLATLLPAPMDFARFGTDCPSVTHEEVTTGNNGPGLIQHLVALAETLALGGGHQYILLDEIDSLGEASMRSMKAVMRYQHAVFIMTTNNIGAIESGLKSRSHLIDMTTPPATAWLERCRQVLAGLGATRQVSDDHLTAIIAACNGDAREIMTEMELLAPLLR